MKKLLILIISFIAITGVKAQSKSDLFNAIQALDNKIQVLNNKVDQLKTENSNLKLEIELLKSNLKNMGYPYIPKDGENSNSNNVKSRTTQDKPVSSGRCQATTKKGTQCSRNAEPGRNYCWQH